jgi:glycosyltransferase involved in cell wall biosynthesis
VRRSDCVIAISDHGRQAIIEAFGVEPSRVRRIYFGVDSEVFHPDDRTREPFVLYPANRWRHKNHDRLFRAMAIVRETRPEISLVLTGVGHDDQPLPAGVVSLGHVPAARLPELYRSASALVFPSLYEGFGLPVVEAMSSGCPVACSDAAALPEIAGGAAALFDPLSPESMADAVLRVLGSPDDYRRRGLIRAAEFTWAKSARQHDAVYRDVGASA